MANIYDQFDAQSEVKDLATSFGVGSNQLLKMAGDVYGLATGNMDNVVSRQGQENIDYLQRGKSQKLIDSETRRKAAVDMEEGTLNQALAYVRETFTDPRLFLSTTAEAAPSLVGAGGIGAGARVATGKVLAKVGAEKAAETATKVGVGTAVAAGAGMQGTSVGADQYKEIVELLSNMPEDQALKVPQIVQLVVEKNATLEEAKTALALDLARSTGALSALASIGTQMLPGGRTIEKALVGGAGKKIAGAALTRAGVGAIGEGLQESLEEGSGAGVKNLLARAVDPEREITKGVGEAMGAGFAGAGPIGAAAGAASRPSRPVLASETTAGMSSEPLASDAIPQETRTSTTDTPDLSLEGAGEMNTREVGSVLSARESAARGFTPDPSDIATAENVRRPQIEVSEEAAKAANAPVQEALDEWRTQNPDVGVNITVINDPNMRNTRNYGIRGYFDPNTGEVVINSAFTKPFEVESVVNHEWSHHTLSSEEGRAALVEFATRDIPQEELAALAKRYPNADNLTLVEEWIARNQEKSPGTFARIIAKIREWLNGKLGINMSNEEVARVMLRTLRERGAPVAEGSGEMRQSTTEQPLANDATSRSSGIMASPSITDIDYSRARQNLTSSAQARFRSQVKDYAPDAVIYNAVGDWKDGAENSVAAIFDTAMPTADLEQLAAKAGLAGDQKAVLWWTTDPNGADAIHRVTWPKDVTMDQARQAMIDAGLENRTLIETPDGVQGFVFDQGQQNLNKISNLHENSTEPSINTQPATGNFLGSSWDNTKSPRAEAKRAYRAVLGRAEKTETGDRGGQSDQRTGVQPEVEPERSSVLAKQPIRESVTEEPISEGSGSKPSDALKLLSADDRESIVEAAQFLARNAGDDALATRLNSVKDVLRLQGEEGLEKAGDAAGLVLKTVIDNAKAPAQKLTNATETDIANRLGRNRTDAGEKLDARDVQKRSKKLEHTVPDEVIDLVHYSSNGDLATVDPASLGKGVATRNDRRGLLKSFYFVRGSPLSGDRNLVSGAGKTVYEAKVASDRIYDANTDALGYWGIINRYDADQMLVKQGYAGLGVTGDDGRQTVTMYEPLAVNNTGQSGDEMRAGEGREMRSKKPIRESVTDEPVGQTKKQTESPEFEKWFEVSKVVNEDGTPKVMFHSTTAGDVLTAFKRNPKDVGFHFGTAGQAEDRFNLKLERDPYGPNLRGVSHATIPVFLRINRPLRMNDLGSWSGDNIFYALKDNPEFKGKLFQNSTSAEARDAIKAAGYDGIVYANTGESEGASVYRKAQDEAWADYQSTDWYRAQQAKRRPSDRFPSEEMNALPEYQAYKKASEAEKAFRESNPQDSYIAFDPNQVKSATGNTGAFDRNKKDIRFSVTDKPVGETALEDAKTLTFKNQIEVSKYLGDLLKKEFPNGLDGRSSEDRANLADMFDRELSLALTIPENADAIGWYSREMQKVFEVLRSPELDYKLDDPTNRGIFNAILAVTSNGQKVVPQFLKTAQLYEKWLKTGKIPPVGKWGGERNSAIKGHLKFLNQLIEAVGPEQTVGFLTSEQSLGDHLTNLYGMVAEAQNLPAEASVADQKAAVKKYLKTTMPSGELVDYNTVGAAVLGPKLGGGFFANLYGKFDRLTMDRWFMRTFHRLTGRLGLQRTDTIAGVLQEARSEAADVLPEDVSDEEILQEINTTGKQAFKNYKSIQNRLKENPDDTEALSQDLMRRLYNRYTKARSGLFDAPDNGGHRNFIRDVVNDVQKLRAERGEEPIDTSDIQAILWYLEKDIWNQLRKKTEVDEVADADAQADEEDGDTEDTAGRVSYSDGARELYRQKTGREFQFQNEPAKKQVLGKE
jgi:hypothetical protein